MDMKYQIDECLIFFSVNCSNAGSTNLIYLRRPFSDNFSNFCFVSEWCTIKLFMGGGGQGGGCGGGNSERCSKWGGGGLLRNLSKTSQNREWIKENLFVGRGRGTEGVTTPALLKF